MPQKAILEHSPSQNTEAKETNNGAKISQLVLVATGLKQIVSVTSQGLKIFFVDFGNNGMSGSNLVRNVNRTVSILTLHFVLKDQSRLGSSDLRLKLFWAILPQQWNAIKLIQLEPHKLQFSEHAKKRHKIDMIWAKPDFFF